MHLIASYVCSWSSWLIFSTLCLHIPFITKNKEGRRHFIKLLSLVKIILSIHPTMKRIYYKCIHNYFISNNFVFLRSCYHLSRLTYSILFWAYLVGNGLLGCNSTNDNAISFTLRQKALYNQLFIYHNRYNYALYIHLCHVWLAFCSAFNNQDIFSVFVSLFAALAFSLADIKILHWPAIWIFNLYVLHSVRSSSPSLFHCFSFSPLPCHRSLYAIHRKQVITNCCCCHDSDFTNMSCIFLCLRWFFMIDVVGPLKHSFIDKLIASGLREE